MRPGEGARAMGEAGMPCECCMETCRIEEEEARKRDGATRHSYIEGNQQHTVVEQTSQEEVRRGHTEQRHSQNTVEAEGSV